jgi:mycothiol synthase
MSTHVAAVPATSEDLEAVAELVAESDAALGHVAPIEVEQLRAFLAGVDLAQESWLLREGPRLVGAAWLITRDPAVAAQFGWVHPGWLGHGVGTCLLELSEARAREVGAAVVHADVDIADAAALHLLSGRGFRVVRYSYEMAIDLAGPPAEPVWSEGIRVAPFRREDARAFYDAGSEAFAEEWGFVPMAYGDFVRLRVDGGDTSLWFVAWDRDEIAGFVRCDAEYRGAGLVRMLGVRPRWRRRGIGEALLLYAFGAFHRRGQTRVTLGVDAANPTGATRLYERVGMRVTREGATYEKALA